MTSLEEITALFQKIDNYLENLREQHDAAGQDDQRKIVKRQQRLNEQAFYVLAWGQLEASIDDACRNAIDHWKSHPDWRQQRTWRVFHKIGLRRLNFESRLTLVLDKASADYRDTVSHHDARSKIAHGEISETPIDFPSVIEKFRHIESLLVQESTSEENLDAG